MPLTRRNTKGAFFPGAHDIVGDVHGEIDALRDLMRELGYDENGDHPEGRHLVFVGDLVDRGPDSPAVLRLVKQLVENWKAKCILGNHELNLLLDQQRPGNAWWFDPETALQESMTPVAEADKEGFLELLHSLPLVLESKELRVAHACWSSPDIDELVFGRGNDSTASLYERCEGRAQKRLEHALISDELAAERDQYAEMLKDPHWFPAVLPAIARADTISQMENSLRKVTSGCEGPTSKPFWAGGKWRMVERIRWWDNYQEDVPVIIGHYWRNANDAPMALRGETGPNMFAGIGPQDWMGKRSNVFCVDYSVGARHQQRAKGLDISACKLAAVRVPEWEVVFDDGDSFTLGPPQMTWQNK